MIPLIAVALLLAQDWTPPSRPPMRRGPDIAVLPTVQPIPGPVLAVEPGSIAVTLSPVPKAAATRILSARAARVAMPWVVTLRNDSSEAVSVAESAVLARISQLQPFDHESMSLLIAEAETNSIWQRTGRAGEDIVKLGAFLAASKNIRIGEPALIGITAGLAITPYIVQRLRGAARPVRHNWERLAWLQPVTLQPGETSVQRVFTAKWDGPQPVAFSLDVGTARAVKAVR